MSAPATSANVGPGFDSLGLALEWRDRVSIDVTAGGFEVAVTGEGAAQMPLDDSHLILASTITGLADLGLRARGLRLRAHNTVPHGRGLGSSSAAIVSGLLAARALAGAAPDPDWSLRHAAAIEGHPDNVAAAIFGGLTLAYGVGPDVTAVRLPVHPEVSGWLFVADGALATTAARGLLPPTVPHADAAANSARAALLGHALSVAPELLLEATRDWLHTRYRRSGMPASYDLITKLRAEAFPAVVSGAGPSVLVLGRCGDLEPLAGWVVPGFGGRPVRIGGGGSVESE